MPMCRAIVCEGRTPEAIELDEWLNGWAPQQLGPVVSRLVVSGPQVGGS
jgi:hypothetical protein